MPTMKFAQMTVGARGQIPFRIDSYDPESGSMVCSILTVDGTDVVGELRFGDVGTGDYEGHIVSLTDTEVDVLSEHFQRGDLIRHIDGFGLTYVVHHMSEESMSVYIGSGPTECVSSGECVLVGHIDPDSIALPA